jgi:transposase
VREGEQPPWFVPDELWPRIKPLLPVVPRRADHPGRKRLDDRKVLCGILFVLYTGIPWEFLPQELGFGSGMTCWRRLRDWHRAGVWQRLHESLPAELHSAGALDWSRAVIDSSHVQGRGASIALLHWFRRLRVRWEIRDDIHEAFLSLACGIICWRRLANLSLC